MIDGRRHGALCAIVPTAPIASLLAKKEIFNKTKNAESSGIHHSFLYMNQSLKMGFAKMLKKK